jgi:hypothetical protein
MAAAIAGSGASWPGTANAQLPDARIGENIASQVFGRLGGLVSSVSGETRDKVFDFLETVELLNAEAEIDRLVGTPWQLHDSTNYKLRLLPLYIAFPIHQQLVRQMTRQDDLRSQRIQNVTPDSVDSIAVRFDPATLDRMQRDVAGSLLRTFSIREITDLSVFAMAQQPLFPRTQEEWDSRKRAIADGKYTLLAGAVTAGALFNAGAFAQSGTIVASQANSYRLNWYGGVRRFGVQLQPRLRGGVTAQAPGLEVAAGVSEQIRPDPEDRRRSLELAFREGWLNRLTETTGWDLFFEGALRRVLASQPLYAGEPITGRAGLFLRRPDPAGLRHVVLRSSAEMESDFTRSARYAVGVGLEHTMSGLTAVIQSSRTAVPREAGAVNDTRTGLLIAGTLEPPAKVYVHDMYLAGRYVADGWQRLNAAGTGPAEREALVAELAGRLADYLDSRRVAYSVLGWSRTASDLHGPLDGKVLLKVRSLVYLRLETQARALETAPRTLERMRSRFLELRDQLERTAPSDPRADAYNLELQLVDESWRRESERITLEIAAYEHFRACARRIGAASQAGLRDPDPLSAQVMRKVILLAALPIR